MNKKLPDFFKFNGHIMDNMTDWIHCIKCGTDYEIANLSPCKVTNKEYEISKSGKEKYA